MVIRGRYPDPPRTPHGIPAPATEGGLRDVWTDVRHGAPRRVITDAMADFASHLPPGARVLEIGAGYYDHGRFFARLERLDLDPRHQPDHLGDAHAMPLEDGSFDAVVAVSVLEHVEDPYQVVREIARVLRPGGVVFAWAPFYFAVHAFPTDIARFTDVGFRRCFERAGLTVEHATKEPYAGVFFNLSNHVHFALPRGSSQRWRRLANRGLVTTMRALSPLDRRLRTETMYAGTELIARKPDPART